MRPGRISGSFFALSTKIFVISSQKLSVLGGHPLAFDRLGQHAAKTGRGLDSTRLPEGGLGASKVGFPQQIVAEPPIYMRILGVFANPYSDYELEKCTDAGRLKFCDTAEAE